MAIAIDTRGPEVRTKKLDRDVAFTIEEGDSVQFSGSNAFMDLHDPKHIFVDVPKFASSVKRTLDEAGTTQDIIIYVDDGALSFVVESVEDDAVMTTCTAGGTVTSMRGVNIPAVNFTHDELPFISEKDRADLQFAVDIGADYIFASFIRNVDDIMQVRDVLMARDATRGEQIKIVSKIECEAAIRNLKSVVQMSCGVMVARGDLAVEIGNNRLLNATHSIVAMCNLQGKPVIVATQMLESMISNPNPTRSEVSDVGNAVKLPADCVMLSGETAKGKHPVRVAQQMANICWHSEYSLDLGHLCDAIHHARVESYLEAEKRVGAGLKNYGSFFGSLPVDLIGSRREYEMEVCCYTAACLARNVRAKAIIVLSRSGGSAYLISKYLPPCPIAMVTRHLEVARQSRLFRGILPIYCEWERDTTKSWADDVNKRVVTAASALQERGYVREHDTLVVVTGSLPGSGHTNAIRLVPYEGDLGKLV